MSECPVPSAHGRLNSLHRHWHHAAESYAGAEGFCAYLNSALEASRNVTFALQKEGPRLTGFDTWYESWQATLKADPVMKWLHNARTEVVHREDLVTHSRAEIRLLNWLSHPYLTLEVPPEIPTEMIAERVARGEFPSVSPPDLAQTVLEVERRWVAADLPDRELLEVLAHGYAVLYSLLADLHERQGSHIASCSRADRLHGEVNLPAALGAPLPCMLAQREARIVRVDLGDERPIAAEVQLLPPLTSRDVRRVERRYGPFPKAAPEMAHEPDISVQVFHFADMCWRQAKKTLQVDGYHTPMVFLFSGSKTILGSLELPGQTSKYVVMQKVAEQVRLTGAEAVIFISEVWTLSLEHWQGLRAQDDPNRGEALTLTVLTKQGVDREYMMPFTRNALGKIVMGEDRIRQRLPGRPFVFAPVLEALGRHSEVEKLKDESGAEVLDKD